MEFSCREHPKQAYLFYCIDHDAPCCAECKRVSHQPTCNLEVMEPFANDKDFGIKMADILKRMNKTLTILDILQEEFNIGRTSLTKQKDQFENDMKRFRRQIEAKVDEIENLIRDEFADLYNKEMDLVRQKEVGVLRKRDTITNWVKGVEELAKEDTSLQSYVYLSKLNSNFSVIEKHVTKTQDNIEHATLCLSIPPDALEPFRGLKLAHTKISHSKSKLYKAKEDDDIPESKDTSPKWSLQKVGNFSVGRENDFHSPLDIKVLDTGEILVVNLNNRRLEIFDQNGVSFLEMELSHNPLHIAVLENQMVAMTLANEKKIIIMDLNENKVSRQIQTDDECHGIAFADKRLFVNCKNYGLLIMNSNFTIENKLPDIIGKQILCGRPDGTVVCGAPLTNEIYCINSEGTKLFQCTPSGLEYLNGISVTDNCEVYVSGYLSNSVHRIEANGSKDIIVLKKDDDIYLPSALSYDKITRSLLVLNNDGDNLLIFNSK